MQLRQLENFEAVHRLRSFTLAAREQFVSQSALSRSIRALEDELGQPLFDRTTHAVEPTEAAEALIGHAVDALAAARQVLETARLLSGGGGGSVAIGTGPYPASPLMTRVIRRLSAERPGLQVTLSGGGAAELLGALVRRELDFVVCDTSKAQESPAAGEIQTIELPREPLAVVVSAAHELVTAEPTPNRVMSLPLVLPPPAPTARRIIARSVDPEASARTPFYEVDSTSSCLDVVQDGRSVTLVPLSLARRDCNVRGLAFHLAGRAQSTRDGLHTLRARTMSTSAGIARDAVLAEAAAIAAETRAWRRSSTRGWHR